MKHKRNIAQMQKDISERLVDSIWLLETLHTLSDGEGKMGTIIDIINGKLKSAFKDVSKCRRIISQTD